METHISSSQPWIVDLKNYGQIRNYHGSVAELSGAPIHLSSVAGEEAQAPGSVSSVAAFKDPSTTSVLSATCASGSGKGHLLTPCPTAR